MTIPRLDFNVTLIKFYYDLYLYSKDKDTNPYPWTIFSNKFEK